MADIALNLAGDAEGAAATVRSELAALDSLPRDAEWLYTINALGFLAATLGDVDATRQLYLRLIPYRERIVTTGRASFCSGSPALSLGRMAATLGDTQAARVHLEYALARHEAIGAVRFTAITRKALAQITLA
jgi:hypothetical protein